MVPETYYPLASFNDPLQVSESSFVKRSAASMLSGKRPVHAAVRILLIMPNFIHL